MRVNLNRRGEELDYRLQPVGSAGPGGRQFRPGNGRLSNSAWVRPGGKRRHQKGGGPKNPGQAEKEDRRPFLAFGRRS